MTDPFRAALPRVAPRGSLVGRPPRLLADVHLFVPEHNAGAEVMLHSLLRAAQASGWDVRVAARDIADRHDVDGIEVCPTRADASLGVHYGWADAVITHLDVSRRAMAWAQNSGRPLVHLVHNHLQLERHGVDPDRAALVIWNSRWIADRYGRWPGLSIVVRPPVEPARYATPRGAADRVTLVNLTAEKGADLFWTLAAMEPERRFLAVRGCYGEQMIPYEEPSNAIVWENGPDARAIYASTRVLLAPSSYESWGMAAVEALASGIPVIAHPTPGLRESLGPAGIFIDRADLAAWRSALAALDDPVVYGKRARIALARSASLGVQATSDLDRFVDALHDLLPRGPRSA